MSNRAFKFKDLQGTDGLIREGGQETIEIVGKKELFLLDKHSVKKLLPSLVYYAKTGRLPDPSVIRLIRNHPWLGNWKGDQEVRKGNVELVVCHNCEDLHLWEARVACDKCGHRLLPIKESNPEVLEVILKKLNEQQHEKEDREKRDQKYPFPKRREDHIYRCQACKKPYTSTQDLDDEDRIACSEPCLFALLNHPMPDGRKWTGFMSWNAYFKGGKVFYLGEATVEGKKCECYHWHMVPDGAAMFYAYHGEGEGKYILGNPGCASGKHRYGHIVEKLGPENAIDESWRIAANVMKRYFWDQKTA